MLIVTFNSVNSHNKYIAFNVRLIEILNFNKKQVLFTILYTIRLLPLLNYFIKYLLIAKINIINNNNNSASIIDYQIG